MAAWYFIDNKHDTSYVYIINTSVFTGFTGTRASQSFRQSPEEKQSHFVGQNIAFIHIEKYIKYTFRQFRKQSLRTVISHCILLLWE